jgi:hypothetical protein
VVDGIMAGEMHDQRMIGRPPLGGEDPGDGCRVGRIRPEPVDGLGREGDQFAGAQQRDGTAIVVVDIRVHSSLMPIAVRAASRNSPGPLRHRHAMHREVAHLPARAGRDACRRGAA